MKRAIAVVGPTASGKTRLAVALARRLNTEVLSADSMQFYRGMEIGTAAPTPEEQGGIRHHFISFLPPDADMAAGRYERLARGSPQACWTAGAFPCWSAGPACMSARSSMACSKVPPATNAFATASARPGGGQCGCWNNCAWWTRNMPRC